MRYAEYQNRMKKAGQLIERLWHFRVLILCLFVAAVAFIVTMSSVAGIVSDATECPATILYGDELPYRAKAVFQGVRYEYRREGSEEWSEEPPMRVGEYWVRAVSKGAGKRGKEHFFTVLPRQVEVSVSSDWTYGELPSPQAQLVNGDTLSCGSYQYRYGAETFITPQEDSVQILHGTEDVTNCYEISVREQKVTVTPRELFLKIKDAEKIYDGTELTCTDYEIAGGSLAFDDQLLLTPTVAQLDVGSTDNLPAFAIAGSGGDVTAYYSVTMLPGTLTVQKRPITVTVEGLQKEYDGTPLRFEPQEWGEEKVTGLVSGHRVSLSGSNRLTRTGQEEMGLSAAVLNENGTDVTKNYDITLNAGMLTVTPRPIVVTTGSMSFEYDGEPHSYEHIASVAYSGAGEGEALAAGEEARVKKASTSAEEVLLEGGEVKGVFNIFEVAIELGGEDRTDCYFITYSYGTLTITPRSVIITSKSRSWVYDGEEHGGEEGDAEAQEGRLVKDHYPVLHAVAKIRTVKESGTENKFTATILDGSGNDVTHNYALDYRYGTLEITPRPITVTSSNRTWMYDAKEHTPSDDRYPTDYRVTEGELVSGQILFCTSTTGITEVSESGAEHRFTVAIFSDGENVTDNYDITYRYGVLVITARVVKIAMEGSTFVYDGQKHGNKQFRVLTEEGVDFVEGHRAEVIASTEIVNVKESGTANELLEYTVWDENERDVTQNYDIQDVERGELIMLRRTVTVQTQSAETQYNGTLQEYRELEVVGDTELVSGHSLRFDGLILSEEEPYDRIDANVWENAVAASVCDENNNDQTDNYELLFQNGTVTIAPREVTVCTGDVSIMYDGKLHGGGIVNGEKQFHADEQTPLAAGDDLALERETRQYSEVCEAQNELTVRVLNTKRPAAAQDVTKNYVITYRYGKFEITPRPVKFRSFNSDGSDAWVYDGKAHTPDPTGYQQVVEEGFYELVAGHSAEYTADERASITQVKEGPVENSFTVHIFSPSGNPSFGGKLDKTHNYAITYEFGELTLLPRAVSVVMGSEEFIYDGAEHECLSYRVDGESKWDFLPGHSCKITQATRIRDVNYVDGVCSEVPNLPIAFRVVDEEEADVTDNYSLSWAGGTLLMKPRPVTVLTQSGSYVYDGTRHEFTQVSVISEEGAAPGEEVCFLETVSDPALPYLGIDVGRWDNLVRAGFLREGEDDTQNYEITYRYGTLTVTALSVKLLSEDETFIYNGREQCGSKVTVFDGAFAPGDEPRYTFTSFLTEVGDADNVFSAEVFCGERSVGHNYALEYRYGSLRIDPRPITVQTASAEFYYDGTAHSAGECFVTEEEGSYPLVEGHTLRAVALSTLTEPGEQANRFEVLVFEGEREVTWNYSIGYRYGLLTVLRRHLLIRTAGAEFEYDGQPHSKQDGYVLLPAEEYPDYPVHFGLLPGHQLEVESYPSLTDVGTVMNTLTFRVMEGGANVTDFYSVQLTRDSGELAITSRSITVQTQSATHEYDGTRHVFDELTLVGEKQLVPGHTLKFAGLRLSSKYPRDRIDVRATPWENAVFVTILDSEGNNVTHNYGILPINGSITITPRKITVKSPTESFLYDAQEHASDQQNFRLTEGEIAAGEIPYFTPLVYLTEVDEQINRFEVSVYGAAGEETTQNYEIGCEYGVISVVPRPVKIVTDAAEFWYDANGHNCATFSYPEGNDYELVPGHRLIPLQLTVITEVGSLDNVFSSWKVTDESGEDVTGNYAIEVVGYGKLTVRYRVIITLYEVEKVYDGTPLEYEEDDWYLSENFGELEVEWKLYGSLTDAGSLDMKEIASIPMRVLKEGRELPQELYKVEIEGTPLTVHKRVIVFTSASRTEKDMGQTLTDDGWSITFGQLLSGHTAEVQILGSQTGVGVSENTIGVVIIWEGEGAHRRDVSQNYDVVKKNGTLELT